MTGTRTFPGADDGSDHDLVMMAIKIKLLKKRKEKQCVSKTTLKS